MKIQTANEDWSVLAVLADALQENRKTVDLGEKLALVLQAQYRGHSLDHTSPIGVAINKLGPFGIEQSRASNLTHVWNIIYAAEQRLFPQRQAPCKPNAKALAALFKEHYEGDNPRRDLHLLKRAIVQACEPGAAPQRAEQAMTVANHLLEGYGVEAIRRGDGTPTSRFWRETIAIYVNMGDPYVTTLIYETYSKRFRVAVWGNLLPTWARHFGPL
jgi:hypothetical protein